MDEIRARHQRETERIQSTHTVELAAAREEAARYQRQMDTEIQALTAKMELGLRTSMQRIAKLQAALQDERARRQELERQLERAGQAGPDASGAGSSAEGQ